jgi:sulfopyruvate decarboxylase subunit alpha
VLSQEAAPSSTVVVPSGLDWQDALADSFVANGVTTAVYVPDSRLQGIILRLDELQVPLRSLTREEECVAYAAGQRLGGKRPLVLLQSSGLGNCLNALASLAVPSRLGIPLVVSMRGSLGEGNPSQVPIGHATPTLLSAVGIQSYPLRSAVDADQLASGVCSLAFQARECAAILLAPELGGGRETR